MSVMATPGIHLETLANPARYTDRQIDHACAVAQLLNRGKFVLAVKPERVVPGETPQTEDA